MRLTAYMMMGLGRDDTCSLRIPHHNVSIRTLSNNSLQSTSRVIMCLFSIIKHNLLRVNVEDPGSCGAGHSHIATGIHQSCMLGRNYVTQATGLICFPELALTTPFSQMMDMRSSTPVHYNYKINFFLMKECCNEYSGNATTISTKFYSS